MKPFQAPEKSCDHWETFLGCAPEDGMLARVRNFERLLLCQTDQTVVARQPILGKHADVDVNANGCARNADRVRTILQDMRHRHLLFFAWQSERSASHFLGHCNP